MSFRYLTNTFCQQADPPSCKSIMRWDVDTSSMVQEAVSLPDLGEASMSHHDWTRASQRFVAILRSLGNPNVLLWERHCQVVLHHASAWPLPLLYCIGIRRRCVNDQTLDMGMFQRCIFNSIRPDIRKNSKVRMSDIHLNLAKFRDLADLPLPPFHLAKFTKFRNFKFLKNLPLLIFVPPDTFSSLAFRCI